MDCSPPGFSAHGILQARILEWVAISFSKGSFQPRDRTRVSCLADRFFTTEPPGKPNTYDYQRVNMGRKVNQELGMKMHIVLYIR